MKRISFALGFLLLPIVLFAYSNPGRPTGFVNDFASILSPVDKTALETKLSDLEKSTGNEVSIVIISSLGGDAIENFAVNLYKDWGLGKRGIDNGALVLVSIADRQIRIEVGYGLEPTLTDITTSRIISETITPEFKKGNYAGGLSAGVDQIIAVLNGEVLSPSTSSSRSNLFFPNFFYFIFFVFVYLASILGRSKSWWMGGVMGGIVGIIVGFIYGFLYAGMITIVLLVPLGLLFDFLVSRSYEKHKTDGTIVPWWFGGGGGGGGGFGGGGFGGFGGGMSGGGGSSGRW